MTAFICVAGLGATLLVAMVHAWWLSRRYRRQAQSEARADLTASVLAGGALQPGPACLVGRCEPIDGSASPLSIQIEQAGLEEARGGWVSHRWEETARQVEVRPFRLVLENGQQVRVEPGDDVVLMGPVERQVMLPGGRRRLRQALIPAGTVVQVSGQVRTGIDPAAAGASGYRDPGRTLVLAGAPGQPLVCSTTPQQARMASRAEWYHSTAVLFAILLGITQLGIYGRFHLLGTLGKQVRVSEAQMTVRRATPRSRFLDIASQASFVDALGRHRLSDRVQFDEVPRPRSFSTYTLIPGLPSVHQLGERPRIGLHLFFWVSLLCGALVIGHVRRSLRDRSERPWYRGGPLVEEGSGPLPLPPEEAA